MIRSIQLNPINIMTAMSYSARSFLFLAIAFLQPFARGQVAGRGEIHGKISVSAKDEIFDGIMHERMMSRYAADPSMTGASVPGYSLSEQTVIYIEGLEGLAGTWPQKSSPPAVHPQLNQRDLIFRPLVLPVVAGTTVDFPNNDKVFHNVFSYSQKKEFDLGRYPQGKMKSVTFDKPGIVNVYCEIHQYMFATILVLDNPYFALPDDEGLYAIKDIPAGTYQLTCWRGRKKVDTRSVTVKANEVTAVNFSN